MKKVIFMAGAYGVGKSTLGNKISKELNIPFYSAGDLISENNNERYGANKFVKDKVENQNILVKAVENKLSKETTIILAGHFCIFNKNNEVEYIPKFVFQQMHLAKIILLETDATIIYNNLKKRDNKEYSIELIEELIRTERNTAKRMANNLNIPLIIHKMKFDSSDISIVEGVRL